MGDVHKTLQNLQVVKVDAKKNIVCIKGATPGARGTWLVLEDSIKNKPNKDELWIRCCVLRVRSGLMTLLFFFLFHVSCSNRILEN